VFGYRGLPLSAVLGWILRKLSYVAVVLRILNSCTLYLNFILNSYTLHLSFILNSYILYLNFILNSYTSELHCKFLYI